MFDNMVRVKVHITYICTHIHTDTSIHIYIYNSIYIYNCMGLVGAMSDPHSQCACWGS